METPCLSWVLPGLTVGSPIDLGMFRVESLANVEKLGLTPEDVETARKVGALFHVQRGADAQRQGVVLQLRGKKHPHLGLASCEFLALSSATKGHLLAIAGNNMGVTDPLYFFRAPVVRGPSGHTYLTTREVSFWGAEVERFRPYWPIEEPLPSTRLRVDAVLCRQLVAMQSHLARKRPDKRAILVLRAVELMNHSLEGHSVEEIGFSSSTRRYTLHVAAFEALARAFGLEEVGQLQVLGLVHELEFKREALGRKRERYSTRKGKRRWTTPAGRVVHEVYRYRNDLAHGKTLRRHRTRYKEQEDGAWLISLGLLVFRRLLRSYLDQLVGPAIVFPHVGDFSLEEMVRLADTDAVHAYSRDSAEDSSFEDALAEAVGLV